LRQEDGKFKASPGYIDLPKEKKVEERRKGKRKTSMSDT
jgi:hypothetical protein